VPLKILFPSIEFTKERAKGKRAFYKIPVSFENSGKNSYYPRHQDAHAHSSFRFTDLFGIQLSSMCGKHHPLIQNNTETHESCSRPR